MTYKGYADKEKRKEYLKGYMRDFRKAQSVEDAETRRQNLIMRATLYDTIEDMEAYINDFMASGHTREEAEDSYTSIVGPQDEIKAAQMPDETPCATTASVAVPQGKSPCHRTQESQGQTFDAARQEPKIEACVNFGKVFHKDSDPPCNCLVQKKCDEAYMAERLKSEPEKERDRIQSIMNLLKKIKATAEEVDRRESAERWTIYQASYDAEQKLFDADVKKWMDRGIPEGAARESATWEQKQRQNQEARETREFERARQSMTDEEWRDYRIKLLKDNRKLLGET